MIDSELNQYLKYVWRELGKARLRGWPKIAADRLYLTQIMLAQGSDA